MDTTPRSTDGEGLSFCAECGAVITGEDFAYATYDGKDVPICLACYGGPIDGLLRQVFETIDKMERSVSELAKTVTQIDESLDRLIENQKKGNTK